MQCKKILFSDKKDTDQNENAQGETVKKTYHPIGTKNYTFLVLAHKFVTFFFFQRNIFKTYETHFFVLSGTMLQRLLKPIMFIGSNC